MLEFPILKATILENRSRDSKKPAGKIIIKEKTIDN